MSSDNLRKGVSCADFAHKLPSLKRERGERTKQRTTHQEVIVVATLTPAVVTDRKTHWLCRPQNGAGFANKAKSTKQETDREPSPAPPAEPRTAKPQRARPPSSRLRLRHVPRRQSGSTVLELRYTNQPPQRPTEPVSMGGSRRPASSSSLPPSRRGKLRRASQATPSEPPAWFGRWDCN